MGEANSPLVAHVDYDISPLSRVKKYRNPRATEGESTCICNCRYSYILSQELLLLYSTQKHSIYFI